MLAGMGTSGMFHERRGDLASSDGGAAPFARSLATRSAWLCLLAQELAEVPFGELGARQPRERAEFADQAAQRAHFLLDDLERRVEQLAERRDRSPSYLRWHSSTASKIGVSGFLISWASRRAISCHVPMRCKNSMRARFTSTSESMRLNPRDRSVSSSLPSSGTRTSRSPPATAWVASASAPMRRVTLRASSVPRATATTMVTTENGGERVEVAALDLSEPVRCCW